VFYESDTMLKFLFKTTLVCPMYDILHMLYVIFRFHSCPVPVCFLLFLVL
jgi:hypothetical protein